MELDFFFEEDLQRSKFENEQIDETRSFFALLLKWWRGIISQIAVLCPPVTNNEQDNEYCLNIKRNIIVVAWAVVSQARVQGRMR